MNTLIRPSLLPFLMLVAAACATSSNDADGTSSGSSDGGSASAPGGGGTAGGTTTSSSTGTGGDGGGGAGGTAAGGDGGTGGTGGEGGSLPMCDESLTTGGATIGGWDGMMFDVLTMSDVTIHQVDLPLITGTHDVEIYVVSTGFYASQTNATVWTQVASAAGVVSSGPATPMAVVFDTPLTLPPGSQYGFYVTTVGSDGFGVEYSAGTVIGAQGASDSHLLVLDGVGTSYPFQGAIGNEAPRRFDGVVHYETPCAP